MTNIARTWPACQHIDMTSPSEIEAMAQRIADLPNGEARKPLVAEYKTRHSTHVMNMVRKRAETLLAQNRGSR